MVLGPGATPLLAGPCCSRGRGRGAPPLDAAPLPLNPAGMMMAPIIMPTAGAHVTGESVA
jgi:hypothetical protein